MRSGSPSYTEGDDSDLLTQATSTLSQVSSVLNSVNQLTGGESTGTGGTGTGGAGNTTNNGGIELGGSSTSFRVPFDISYEVDIWGKLQRSYESAQSQFAALVIDVEVVRQTLLADLVQNYFALRSLDAQQVVLVKNLSLYEEEAGLTQQRYDAGLIGASDVLQAQVQLETTRVQESDTTRQRNDREHAIAILLGRAPADFALAAEPLTEMEPPHVPAGLPSDLLRRRPDVGVAEQNLVSASAEIGVAQANLYPSISLTGSAGFEGDSVSNLLDWRSAFWSFGPNVSMPIFNGGQLKAEVEQARARYAELEANYRDLVLESFRSVEDSLTDLHTRADQASFRRRALEAAREYARLARLEYDAGSADYLEVVHAEQTLLTNELAEIELMNDRFASTVLLIKALGGGWDSALAQNAQSTSAG